MSWRDLTAKLTASLTGSPPLPSAPVVDADLARSFDAVAAEYHGATAALLSHRLRTLVHRRVPIRHLTSAPVVGTGRLIFADGTSLLVRGPELGDLGAIAVQIAVHRAAYLVAWRPTESGADLLITLGGRQILLGAIGLDQAD